MFEKITQYLPQRGWRRPRVLPDQHSPQSPHFLRAEDHLVKTQTGGEILVKRIFSELHPNGRPVVLMHGLGHDGNLFRIGTDGKIFNLDNNRSLANYLATQGFEVYVPHLSTSERVVNRYAARYCPNSQYFGKTYRVSPLIDFSKLLSDDLPAVLDYVFELNGRQKMGYVGFSMGGMLLYAHLALTRDDRIYSGVTVGGPIAFSHRVLRLMALINFWSSGLGLEERNPVTLIGENFVPLSRAVSSVPKLAFKFIPGVGYLYSPWKIGSGAVRTFFGKVTEPIPRALKDWFIAVIRSGNFPYSDGMRDIKTPLLFIYGRYDGLAEPLGVRMAHRLVSGSGEGNLKEVRASHLDLILGKAAPEEVWEPTVRWLQSF